MLKSKKWCSKRIIFVSLLCLFLALILVIIIYHAVPIDKKYNRIRAHRDTVDQVWQDWYYNDVKYSVAPGLSLYGADCTEENGFYLVSWCWYVPVLKKFEMYGDNVENPRFLYCPHMGLSRYVRISENYDYMDEEYVLFRWGDSGNYEIRIDTEYSFKLKDVYYPDESIKREYEIKPIAYLSSHSRSSKRLEFYGDIYLVDNKYYICFSYSSYASEQTYKIKPEFIELLKKAGIIESDS